MMHPTAKVVPERSHFQHFPSVNQYWFPCTAADGICAVDILPGLKAGDSCGAHHRRWLSRCWSIALRVSPAGWSATSCTAAHYGRRPTLPVAAAVPPSRSSAVHWVTADSILSATKDVYGIRILPWTTVL